MNYGAWRKKSKISYVLWSKVNLKRFPERNCNEKFIFRNLRAQVGCTPYQFILNTIALHSRCSSSLDTSLRVKFSCSKTLRYQFTQLRLFIIEEAQSPGTGNAYEFKPSLKSDETVQWKCCTVFGLEIKAA